MSDCRVSWKLLLATTLIFIATLLFFGITPAFAAECTICHTAGGVAPDGSAHPVPKPPAFDPTDGPCTICHELDSVFYPDYQDPPFGPYSITDTGWTRNAGYGDHQYIWECTCSDCHGAEHPVTVPGTINIAGSDCSGCHTSGMSAEVPQVGADHGNLPVVHGGIATADCASCHGSDVTVIHTDCATCHATSPPSGATCATCHDDLPPKHYAGAVTRWSYADLADDSPKYEGGYADCGTCHAVGADTNPHGGYDTSTNKCKVCHAVHRAEGAYYLLRADSQDDACDYCHVGGSAHSSKVVYDLNSGGKDTTNGHTIGAATYIPDSTIAQWTEDVTLTAVDANGDPITETIRVRAYDEQKNDMYRFARHHGHSEADGGARRNYVPVGPLALRCMNCHQVHNATAQTWQSLPVVDGAGTQGQTASAYKLLKQFPSGTFVGGTDSYGQIPLANISVVPETTLTAGVNYDASRAQGDDPSSIVFRGREYNKPMWVASEGAFDGEHDPTEPGAEQSVAAAVNNAALSVWCADCHNLNIGGWKHLDNEELGFKAHAERTHPAPFTGAHSGPGQCYSCHRNDLPRINSGDSCSQCHYGTGAYYENRVAGFSTLEYVSSDFPHSGEDGDYKMLGSYSVDAAGLNPTTIVEPVTIGADNLDAVCLRCHWVEEKYHAPAPADVTAPVTTSDVQASYAGPAIITLSATDSGSGVAHTYYRLDGGPETEGTTISVPAPASGTASHFIEYWSVDTAGNVELPHKTASFTVSPAPSGTITLMWYAPDGSWARYWIYDAQGHVVAEASSDTIPGWYGFYTATVPVSSEPYYWYSEWYDSDYDEEGTTSGYATIGHAGAAYSAWY